MNLFTESVQLVLSLLYISLLDASFMFMCACAHDTVFNIRVLVLACHLAVITALIGEFLTPLDLHVQILELRP